MFKGIIDLNIEIIEIIFPPFSHQNLWNMLQFWFKTVFQTAIIICTCKTLEKAFPWKRPFLGKGLTLEKLWAFALEKAAWLEEEDPEIIQNHMWILAFSTKLLLPMRNWLQTWVLMNTCPGQMHHAQLDWSSAFLCGGHV